jgi:hypothetical protein
MSQLNTRALVQVCQLTEEELGLDTTDTKAQSQPIPHEVQQLLTSYADIFATKVQFPPPRPFSHSIPLIPRPRLFFIKPYRYTPALKNEIEHQVQEMLDAGLIQHSTSPFSSPMILVKKKDNTFRFYVDYMHHNAITVMVMQDTELHAPAPLMLDSIQCQ